MIGTRDHWGDRPSERKPVVTEPLVRLIDDGARYVKRLGLIHAVK